MEQVTLLIEAAIDDNGKLLLPFSRLDCDLWLPPEPIKFLPDNLHIGGYLDVRSTELAEVPRGLHVGGNFFLSGTHVISLPDDLVVEGDLHLEGTEVAVVPASVKIGGEIHGLGGEEEM